MITDIKHFVRTYINVYRITRDLIFCLFNSYYANSEIIRGRTFLIFGDMDFYRGKLLLFYGLLIYLLYFFAFDNDLIP